MAMSVVRSIDPREQLAFEAFRLVEDVKALQSGAWPFEGLTVEERREQLAQLGLELAPTTQFPELVTMNDNQLIAAAELADHPDDPLKLGARRPAYLSEATAEILRRIDATAGDPDPEER